MSMMPNPAPNLDAQLRFERIVEPYQKLFFHIARRILQDSTWVEDVVQDALLKAYGEYMSFSEERQQALDMKVWLCVIVRNTALNFSKREHKFTYLPFSEILEIRRVASPFAYVSCDLDLRNLYGRIQTLPERFAQVLLLRYIADLSCKEIAELLGWQENRVSVTVRRAIQRLQRDNELRQLYEEWVSVVRLSLAESLASSLAMRDFLQMPPDWPSDGAVSSYDVVPLDRDEVGEE